MNIDDIRNKEKIAIVAVGYNRIDSMQRLFMSLSVAQYPNNDIPLYISIDASGDEELYDYVRNFEWNHGDKYVNIQQERLGLRKHIIQCGDLTRYFKAVVILEDDIFVSEFFYDYISKAVDYYGNDSRIGGFSLYQNNMKGLLPVCFLQDGSDAYLKQSPASWGECWTEQQWNGFKEWYDQFDDTRFSVIEMPEYIKKWKKAWSKYYMAYLIETNRYFVFPQISHTTCFGDAGEHSSMRSTYGQANILCGKRDYCFRPFDEMVRYDLFGANEDLYFWIGIDKTEIVVDFYALNDRLGKRRYLLTPAKLSYPVVRSFSLEMFPIELNVKYNIQGDGLYLYDTGCKSLQSNKLNLPLQLAYYYLKGFDIRLLARYSWDYIIRKIIYLIKKRLHLL